ncbi:F-box domain containing protein [Pandoravirus neocaledonia]|uniref:F-box domain containing protein n=1 Tax=Pandoravirus neocaledonia TaxID=2107708 RepID=A0A2U7UCA0_9VIRU|nr:F-box domain containing protein [Pandoravirus neocaledonia]AVK76022.1 F-box domain containing protein [Pandoravirus neocaledonia]
MAHATSRANTEGDVSRTEAHDRTDDISDGLFGATDVPAEIWAHILASVDARWRFCARSVCRQWRVLVERLPAPCALDVPASKRRLARGYRICASAAASAYCRVAAAHTVPPDTGQRQDQRGGRDGVNIANEEDGNDDYNVASMAGDAGDHGHVRSLRDSGSEAASALAVDRILAIAGWTRDGTTKRRAHGLDIVIGLLHTGDEAAVDSAFSWLETRPLDAAACLSPSDPCGTYAAVGRVLARHARMDWMRRAECALVGFVARDHCSPMDALLSGDAAFAAEVNGTEPRRWYACARVWETAGRLGAVNVVRDLIAAAEADAPFGTYRGLPPCLRAFHWHVWPSGMLAHPHGQPSSGFETCARIAARTAISRGHTNVVVTLLDRAGGMGGFGNHSHHERELAHLLDDASMAASRKGVEWCLAEAARTSTCPDVIKATAMAVVPISLRTGAPDAYPDHVPYGSSHMGDRTKGKWHRGVRIVAWLRGPARGALGPNLDAPKLVAAIIDNARVAKTQLALMLVYAPALASMYTKGSHAGDHAADGEANSAVDIVTGIARQACSEAFLSGKTEILERLIAALDALARQAPLDSLVTRVGLRACVAKNTGAHAPRVLAYARHRAAGLGMVDAADRALAAPGKGLQAIVPWTYEAPKAAWRRWWPSCNDHDAIGGPEHCDTSSGDSFQKINGAE